MDSLLVFLRASPRSFKVVECSTALGARFFVPDTVPVTAVRRWSEGRGLDSCRCVSAFVGGESGPCVYVQVPVKELHVVRKFRSPPLLASHVVGMGRLLLLRKLFL